MGITKNNSAKYAVIGANVDNSLSPIIHTKFAKQFNIAIEYQKLTATNADEFKHKVINFFKSNGKGLSITAPFKHLALKFATTDINDMQYKAVNTLWLRDNNQIIASNTDGIGLITDMLINKNITIKAKSILILGCGGVVYNILPALLAEQPKRIIIHNRTTSKVAKLIQDFKLATNVLSSFSTKTISNVDIILDCRSANIINKQLHDITNYISNKCIFYCLSYGAISADIILWAKKYNMQAYDGLGMLIEQAAQQFKLWHNKKPETKQLLVHLTKNRQ